jgi:hypothetical protein
VSSYALLDVTPVRGRHFPYWEFLTSNVMAHRDGCSKLDSFVLFALLASGYAGRIEAIRIATSPFQET